MVHINAQIYLRCGMPPPPNRTLPRLTGLSSLLHKPGTCDQACSRIDVRTPPPYDPGERLADLNTALTRSNEELDAFAYVASHVMPPAPASAW